MANPYADIYEAGIRISQALRFIAEGEFDEKELTGVSQSYYSAILLRLEAAVAGWAASDPARAELQKWAESLIEDWNRARKGSWWSFGQIASLCEKIEQLRDLLRKQTKQPETNWFNLGIAITSGSADTDKYQFSDWEVDAPDTVRKLLTSLNVDAKRLFVDLDQLTDMDQQALPGTPEIYWGWLRIEAGLHRMRSSIARLQIDFTEDDGPIATLDGKAYTLNRKQGLYLRAYLQHAGMYINKAKVEETEPELGGEKVERIRKTLPHPIKALFDATRGKGTKLKLEQRS